MADYAGVRVECVPGNLNECLSGGAFTDHVHGTGWSIDRRSTSEGEQDSLVVLEGDREIARYTAQKWVNVWMIDVVQEVSSDADDGSGYDDSETYHELRERLTETIRQLDQRLDTAWGIIANVDSGNGMGAGGVEHSNQTEEWREAAARFRDSYIEGVRGVGPVIHGEPLADWEKELLGNDSVSDAEPSDDVKLFNECRAAAQELLTPLSPGGHWPAMVSSDWHAKRAAWMRTWSL